jgi:malonyl-CoA/methylmalonyl-CoA synthetase
MRLFVSGSAPLLAETHRAFEQRTGHAILERYGMTETSMITSNPYDGERRAGTVGFPLDDIDVRISALQDGVGMIEVKGPNVFQGYWRMPEKTAEEFTADGFFRTGDLGAFDARGYLTINGRGKDLIITGGLNVYPRQVEEAIDALPGVIESAVVGLPHADFGEGVAGFVVMDGAFDERAVIAALAVGLAKFKVPKRIIRLDELPRNAMGKVQKAELRKTHAGLFSARS